MSAEQSELRDLFTAGFATATDTKVHVGERDG
jgi:hypothetical protein